MFKHSGYFEEEKSIDRGEHYYLYTNTVKILPLAFVDDLKRIAKCGLDSMALNTFITTQNELITFCFHIPDANGKLYATSCMSERATICV